MQRISSCPWYSHIWVRAPTSVTARLTRMHSCVSPQAELRGATSRRPRTSGDLPLLTGVQAHTGDRETILLPSSCLTTIAGEEAWLCQAYCSDYQTEYSRSERQRSAPAHMADSSRHQDTEPRLQIPGPKYLPQGMAVPFVFTTPGQVCRSPESTPKT